MLYVFSLAKTKSMHLLIKFAAIQICQTSHRDTERAEIILNNIWFDTNFK